MRAGARMAAVIAFAGAFLCLICDARAQGVTWTGPPGDLWSNADNWDPKVVPNNSPPTTYYNVTVNTPGPVVDGAFTIAGLNLSQGILLTEGSNLGFQSESGSVSVNGSGEISIQIPATFAPASIINGSHLTLSGGGRITMLGAGTPRIIGGAGSSLTNNSWTISGKGRLAEGFMSLSNFGTISASSGTLLVQAAGLDNGNVMRAIPTGTLHITGSFGSLNNAGGTVLASGGLVQFSGNLHVTGGTLRSENGGSFEAIASGGGTHRLRDLNLETDFLVTGSTLEIQDTIANFGSLTLNGSNMRVVGTATLNGGGQVRMSAGTSFGGIGAFPALVLDHGTIRGAGSLGNNQCFIVVGSLGTIRAIGGTLVVDPSGQGISNSGIMMADAGTLVVLGSGTFTNTNGRIRAEAGSAVVFGGDIAVNGGTIETVGTGSARVGSADQARFSNPRIDGNFVLETGSTAICNGVFSGFYHIIMQPSSRIEVQGFANFLSFGQVFIDGAVIKAREPQFGDGPGAQFTNDGLIEGSGNVGANELQITNNGTVRANGAGALTLDPSSEGMLNSGVIEATGAGQVILTGSGAGDFAQDGAGMIRAADPGSNVQLSNGAHLSGGQLGAGAGSISAQAGTMMLEDLMNHAHLALVGVSSLQLNGSVVNNGSITTSTNSRLIINGSVSLSGGAGHYLNNGSLVLSTAGQLDAHIIEGTGTTTVQTGGTLRAHAIRQNRLTIADGASVELKTATPGTTDPSRIGALTIGAAPAFLDITNRVLILDQSGPGPLATLRSQITSGFNGGTWDGPGIRSSDAAANPGHGIGFGEASAIFNSFPANFFGQVIDNTTLLVTYTRSGDANLDRVVGLDDFNRLAANFGLSNRTWTQGDFTYDGMCNLADFNAMAANFGLSAGPGGPTPEDWAALAAAVPEPGAIVWLGAVSLLLTVRIRARRIPSLF